MDSKSILLLIGIVLFFAILHGLILPLARRFSRIIHGDTFTYRLQTWMASKSTKNVAKWDILWSASSVILAMAVTLSLLTFMTKIGIIQE